MFSLKATNRILLTTQKALTLVWGKFKWPFIGQTILLVINAALGYLRPGLMALVINYLTQTPVFSPELGWLLVFLSLVSILPSFINSFQSYLNKITYLNLEQLTELELIKIHSRLEVSQHENPQVKDLVKRVTDEGQWRIKNFTERIIFVFEQMVSLTIAAVILVNAVWWALPLLLLATIPELLASTKYGRRVWSINALQSQSRRLFWEIKGHFTYLPYLLELKLFQNMSTFQRRIKRLFTRFIREEQQNELSRLKEILVSQLSSQLANILVILFFIYMVLQGQILVGTLTFYIATLARFHSSLSSFFHSLSAQYEDSLFVADFFTLRELAPSMYISSSPVILNPDKTPQIEFRNVSFKYPDTKELVLSQISFTLEPGTKLALVGVNGAGKTTLVKLLCRFYDPTAGQILINGHDLREIDLDSWYHHLGILFQEYAQYHFDVRDSISLGRSQLKPELDRIRAASRQADADKFIQRWPLGYKQQLGREFDQGVEPSIGQKQKLALARVFYRQPHIYILDEPTASLDAEAEKKIFDELATLKGNVSTILISHRFSTVRKADQIIVIKDGVIAEQGSHRTLMEHDRIYANLFRLQAKEYE
jgi:ABC-type multidrug transport system fused ATPase/permease subunit